MITLEGCPPCARLKPVAERYCEELGIKFKEKNKVYLPENIQESVDHVPYFFLLDDSDKVNPVILNEWVNAGEKEELLYNNLTKKY